MKQKNDKILIVLSYVVTYVALSLMILLPKRQMPSFNFVKVSVQQFATAALLAVLAVHIHYTDKDTSNKSRKTATMCTTLVLSYAIITFANLWEYGPYLVPFALCSMTLALVVSKEVGFFTNFVVIILYFMQTINFTEGTNVMPADFYLLLSGIVETVFATYVFGNHYRRTRYLFMGFVLGGVSALCFATSYFLYNETFVMNEFLLMLGLSFCSGIVSVMFMFIVVPLFERLFNVVSVFRFSEIASSDTKLMRKLFEKAPGTYNHSLTVAIYAEACAAAIGESPVAARAAAYYHDIGKLKNPTYFAENQLDGVNPHDSMTPENSVSMIKSHTANGLAMAKEYGLPIEVQRAIAEHHGTMPIKYFYFKAQKYTDGTLPYDDYSYDGPKPTSKLSAILMICDASEAALRASGDKSKAESIVDTIVSERLNFNQFTDCDITLKEIEKIKSTIITTFSGIRHERVKYPDAKLTVEDK